MNSCLLYVAASHRYPALRNLSVACPRYSSQCTQCSISGAGQCGVWRSGQSVFFPSTACNRPVLSESHMSIHP